MSLIDGICLDRRSNIWTSSVDEVLRYQPDGTLIGRLSAPEIFETICGGGPALKRIHISA
ncbi:SMP-30/gluconolactonase/LRE family protein [Bosea sp. (in: a-proteobacteria)]|uniref:SMP-30/gluconolactonase/LRE family protein n=1 Tax=Bosea sp. (in: a-proteobacteria) TaxID=1871050 RepID=UPI003523C417